MFSPRPGNTDPYLQNELRRIGKELEELYPKIQTWTPQLWDDSLSNSEGQTYGANNSGQYFRLGDVVFIQGRLHLAGLGTLTTSEVARVGGLPYTPQSSPVTRGSLSVGYAAGLNLAAAVSLSGFFSSLNSIYLTTLDLTTGTSSLLISELSTSSDIVFGGWYITDQKP